MPSNADLANALVAQTAQEQVASGTSGTLSKSAKQESIRALLPYKGLPYFSLIDAKDGSWVSEV
jgi:hypothetical protein